MKEYLTLPPPTTDPRTHTLIQNRPLGFYSDKTRDWLLPPPADRQTPSHANDQEPSPDNKSHQMVKTLLKSCRTFGWERWWLPPCVCASSQWWCHSQVIWLAGRGQRPFPLQTHMQVIIRSTVCVCVCRRHVNCEEDEIWICWFCDEMIRYQCCF